MTYFTRFLKIGGTGSLALILPSANALAVTSMDVIHQAAAITSMDATTIAAAITSMNIIH